MYDDHSRGLGLLMRSSSPMLPFEHRIAASHRVARSTRLTPRDHWPLGWRETESPYRAPDDNILCDNAPGMQTGRDAASVQRTESTAITPRISRTLPTAPRSH